jgi:hypothetical protein
VTTLDDLDIRAILIRSELEIPPGLVQQSEPLRDPYPQYQWQHPRRRNDTVFLFILGVLGAMCLGLLFAPFFR